ncbi:bacillithiol system redox-active protein YtxJ [Paradesertivirga mongoliensis]|uniref:Bacillithiol system redox-active protein YtxJ n=1 Tax=Paradesertivirga mongoliensis TaxID=2100740 RepID=A0ABW4ZNX4_9SPHI|nr:bacillithiol system redox-active protein YtxJ [Pedobacter mongoliensis]
MKTFSLETFEQLENLKSSGGCSVIFKHNTSCPISKNTLAAFEKNASSLPEGTNIYFLDLLSYRELSDAIADRFKVKHESPQILVISEGECRFHQSHYDISAEDAAAAIRSGGGQLSA